MVRHLNDQVVSIIYVTVIPDILNLISQENVYFSQLITFLDFSYPYFVYGKSVYSP